MTDIITYFSSAIIIGVFLFFLYEVIKVKTANKLINKHIGNEDILGAFASSKMENLCEDYRKTICIKAPNGEKSNIPSSSFINYINVAKVHKINLKMLDSASGTLVGLGLLGTFLGLTMGIKNFDSSNSENIKQSIQGLLSGMGLNVTAANHVIHYSRHWNPAKENQATDRAYRIGQAKDVYVYYPMATSKEFKSFDETLDELLSRKTTLATSTIFPTERVEIRQEELGQMLFAVN